MAVPYAWDEAKRVANIEKHGVDFTAIEGFDWTMALVEADTRFHYGEVRLRASAPIGTRLYVVVFTVETRVVRLISLRKANNKEIDRYEASL